MKLRTAVLIATYVLCAGGFHTSLAADAPESVPVHKGVVVSVVGDAVVERAGELHPIAEGFVLLEGDVAVLPRGTTCTVFTPSGTILGLEGPSEHLFPALSEQDLLDKVAEWIREQLASWVRKGRMRSLAVRADPRDWEIKSDTPRQLLPAPDGRVRRSDAEFVWGAIHGIGTYVVTLASGSSDEEDLTVRGSSLKVDYLAEGEEYIWDVRPAVSEWTSERTWRAFRVMTAEDEELLDQALSDVDDLKSGVVLLLAGLHGEAIERLDAAMRRAPSVRAARMWRARALAEVGLHQEACEDLEAAGRAE
jgi:hypothetical protein